MHRRAGCGPSRTSATTVAYDRSGLNRSAVTCVAHDGSRLAVVNAKFDTGFPPTATSVEVMIVHGR
jgi:hypothetical protein